MTLGIRLDGTLGRQALLPCCVRAPCHSRPAMLRWHTVSVAYLILASLACALAALLRDAMPFVYASAWLSLDEPLRSGSSFVLGVSFGTLVIAATRISVRRWEWARGLHQDLRPVARNVESKTLITVAILSSVGEELFFRGLLMPTLGVLVQAGLFGFLHQVRGRSRWVWVAWATLVGLAFGALFALTGSLLGPIAGHALINAHNLIFLRDHDPAPKPARLGGLLAPSDV
jgi:uncharacterized protein